METGGELLFQLPPLTSGALLFGETSDTPVTPDVLANIAGGFRPLRAAARVAVESKATVSGSFAPLRFRADVRAGPVAYVAGAFAPLRARALAVVSIELRTSASFAPLSARASTNFDLNVQRPTVGETGSRWQEGRDGESGVQSHHQDAMKSQAGWEGHWQDAVPAVQEIGHTIPYALRAAPVSTPSKFQQAAAFGHRLNAKHQDAAREWIAAFSTFEAASDLRAATGFRHQDGTHIKPALRSRYEEAMALGMLLGGGFQKATAFTRQWLVPHQDGVPPPAGLSVIPPKPPGPTPCYTPSGQLLFQYLHDGTPTLLFRCDAEKPTPEGPIIVPVKRVYIVLNNTYLVRVSDNLPVPVLSMSVALDYHSWTWKFSANLPAPALEMVEPTANGPVELKAHINGVDFRFLAEDISRDRTFGRNAVNVSGRGRNATLDAPFAPEQVFSNTIARTSQQLLDDVVVFNGIPLGYTFDYQLEPWLVASGVFNHQGTYISALSAIVKAGGGYLRPHPSDLSFKVLHEYPVAPWDTQTPDIVLPSAVVTRETVTWLEKPRYNRVFVRGQEQGVLGQVTRAGTAGDYLAPMVTDQLITTAAAARQRGLAVLANTGKQLQMNLSLPVLADTGIIYPGTYVEYDDNGTSLVGQVRSVNVNVNGVADVKQNIGVQFHV